MNTTVARAIAALFALLFILAACASDSGAQWTYAPAPTSEGGEMATAEPGGVTEAPAEATQTPAEATQTPAEATPAPGQPSGEPQVPGQPSGEPRVIALQADAALRFTDESGQPLTDIPVTPGETIIFQVNNTAGFDHNFWIGTDAELMTPNAETGTGIPTWQSGVQELEWVVPADISGLKFGCTVPGHYTTMQGTFSLAEGGAPATAGEPVTAASEAPAEATEAPGTAPEVAPAVTEAAAQPGEPQQPAQPSGEPRVIELEADPAIRFLQNGEQIQQIPVTPGETVIFRVDNTSGFDHNFYIGPDDQLSVPAGQTDTGIPNWQTGVQELEWVVPADISGLRFACTVPGHYYTMQGDFVLSQ